MQRRQRDQRILQQRRHAAARVREYLRAHRRQSRQRALAALRRSGDRRAAGGVSTDQSVLERWASSESSLPRQWLEVSNCPASGPIPGLCGDALHRFGDIALEYVRVSRRRFDVAMVERLLHELEIASRAQELAGKVVAVVVKAEADDTRALTQPLPIGLHALIGQWVSLTFDAPGVRTRTASLADIGENKLGMMPAQWPQNLADGRRDRHRDVRSAFAGL